MTTSKDREEKRRELLIAVADIAETLESHAAESEQLGTLAQESVNALYDSGLLGLKLPETIGGAEADPVTQIEVIEAVTRHHPSAGWCLMIGATSVGLPGAFLPQEALDQVFPGGQIPTAATAFMPTGQAKQVEGGFLLNGRWHFASGVRHSQWINAGALVFPDEGPPQHHFFCLPTEKAELHDNWQVLGLQATGSCDFSVVDLFVPQEFAWNSLAALPRRGGPLYHMGLPAFLANEHVGFALGVARRALDAIIEIADTRRRGFTPDPVSLSARATFQKDLGICELKLEAVRSLALEIFEEAWSAVCNDQSITPQLHAKTRAVGTYATEVAIEVVSTAFRYGGGSVVFLTNRLQGCLRDIETAAQHLLVGSSAYENYAQFILGQPDANPMA